MNLPILLIEDDQWLADSFLATLRPHGYDVTQLSTAFEAIHWIDKHKPSVIIADVMLGDHNTFTLLHELQSYPDTALIPVIICTALGKESLGDIDLAGYGVVEVLDKTTMTPDQLLLALDLHVPKEPKG